MKCFYDNLKTTKIREKINCCLVETCECKGNIPLNGNNRVSDAASVALGSDVVCPET